MSIFKQGRYSGYLRPLSYVIDLSVINILSFFILLVSHSNYQIKYSVYITLGWIILSLYSKFYEVYRYTRPIKIITLIGNQYLLFLLLNFSFLGFYNEIDITIKNSVYYTLITFLIITIIKFTVFYLLRRYRAFLGGNFRNTVIIGVNNKTKSLESFFKNRPEFGYSHLLTINVDKDLNLEKSFNYIIEEKVDEIYCSISELNDKQIAKIVDFADNNLKVLKFIPDSKEIYSKKLKYEYYDYIPILSLRNIPIEDSVNTFLKRIFDILLSSFIILFVLSWLTPIIAIFIIIESRGPIFFKQSRNGFNYKEFDCYKFRSMMPNDNAHLHQATRGDQRVTKVGKFLRKTSIDELPQFFNVLFGDMSVVGPRPHMVSHTHMYAKNIDKYMVRHFVKPGITGLAQISGFRGEVETESDIVGRVKFDIFYIENWSLLLDLKIVFQTFINAIKGEDKAY